jgi:YbbR domain-containing protein
MIRSQTRPEARATPPEMRVPHIDYGRAAFAFALAVLLYFVAVNETNPEGRQKLGGTVAVQPVNVPAGLVVTTAPAPVSLWVRAPANVFGRLRADSFTAQIDASGASAGDNENLPIAVNWTDPDVRAVDPEPGTARLHLEEIREQVLPVRVSVAGQVPAGYQQGSPTVDPQHVTVAGAASLVGRATEAVVDVSVDRVTVSVNGVYNLRLLDDRGNDLRDLNLRATPPAVTVQVPINQQTQYKQVGVRPVTQGQPAPGYALQPLEVNPATATLVGDAAGLEGANFIDTVPIDINGISTTIVRSVALSQPPGALLLQQGQTVTVTVRVTTLTVNQTVRVPPTIINLAGAVQLARPLDFVSVTISGPAPALSTLALNPNDFRVVLDASGKGPGRWDIDVKVPQVPAGLKLEDFDPKKVSVELRQAPPTPTPIPSPTPPPPPGE